MTVIDGVDDLVGTSGWRPATGGASLAEVNNSIAVPRHGGVWRKALAFAGPGFVISVGYMDPGNWATDIEGRGQVPLRTDLGSPDVQRHGHPSAGVAPGSASLGP